LNHPASTSSDYAYVAFFLVVGIAFVAVTLGLAWLIRRRGRNENAEAHLSTYECGEEPVGQAWTQFHVGYYVIAIMFVVFDIDIVFLAPWAVVLTDIRRLYPELALIAFVEGLVFVTILVAGLVYAVKRGVLRWI